MIYTIAEVNPAVIEWQTKREIRFMTDTHVAEFFAERGQRFEGWTQGGKLIVATIAPVPGAAIDGVAPSEVSQNAAEYSPTVVDRSSDRAP